MQQLQSRDQNGLQRPCGCRLAGCVVLGVEAGLHHLDIPVAELFPYEVIYLLQSDTQLVAVHIVGDILRQAVYLAQNPAIGVLQAIQSNIRGIYALHIHHDETACIPYFIRKVALASTLSQ